MAVVASMTTATPHKMSRPFAVAPVADLDVLQDDDRWLIDGLWAQSAIGVLGGPPKCFKTFLGLEMAVAVATGTDALGHFSVHQQGPALVFLAEDSLPQVRARVEALCRGRGLDLRDVPLHVITEPSLRLDLEHDLRRLASTVRAMKPRLLILDPLVRLHRLDENSASEISGLLSGVRDLQRRLDVAIVLTHHASKKARAHPGQALRGSGDLHALGDSNLYVARQRQGILLTIEQRAARSPDPMWMDLITDDELGTASLRVRALDQGSPDPGAATTSIDDAVLAALTRATGPVGRGDLRKQVGVANHRLGEALERLARKGQITRESKGIVLRRRSTELGDADGAGLAGVHEPPANQRSEIPGEAEAGNAGAQPAEE